MSKVYYFHTTKLEPVQVGIWPRATIALKKEGDQIKYGVSICSEDDQFTKKTGREISEHRLNNGFGVMPVPTHLKDEDDHDICMTILVELSATVVARARKWKRKVTKFNKDYALTQQVAVV